ncbi:glycosyltransferase [Trinickia dabaoshanensis]|nr:glycosyltransferase [Trinickia dabaoshanensis]
MATVSILIAARRAEYLGRALVSARQQTFDDIEILVGDDTIDAALQPIVEGLDDPRVQYIHTGFEDARRNAEALWQRASGKYVKWLAEDDMLMPASVELLVDALRAHPESALAFHARVFVNENDEVVHAPPLIAKVGERALIERSLLVSEMVGQLDNFVGELSNVLIDRERATSADLFSYRSLPLDYLADVATYLNLAQHGPLVVAGGYWSMLRQHPEQANPQSKPTFSAGLYEWELFARGEAAAGVLDAQSLATVANRLRRHYATHAGELPELRQLLANLDELTAGAPQALFDNARFRADWADARSSVAARVARHAQDASQSASEAVYANAPVAVSPDGIVASHVQEPTAQPSVASDGTAVPVQEAKVCVICEQGVDGWVPDGRAPSAGLVGEIAALDSARTLCPKCGCGSSDRHLWLYIAVTGLLEAAPAMRVLHIAPEKAIEARIRRLGPLEYQAHERVRSGASQHGVDPQRLDFPSDYFDLIICNHVLDRVEDSARAIGELHRCLKPGGHLIAQTQYAPMLKYTFELATTPSMPLAMRCFGEPDRMRLFGADVAEHVRGAGFVGDLFPHSDVFGEGDSQAWGVDTNEPLFLFVKPDTSTLAAQGGEQAARPAAAPAVAAAQPQSQPQSRRARSLDDRPIRLVCATRHSQEEFLRETALGRSLTVQRNTQPPELLLFDNNSTGLPTLYNAAIDQAASSPVILVFVHDDVWIADHFWMTRIREALAQFDVVGLAGNRRRSPMQPGWAFETPDFKWDRPEYLSGTVGHGKGFPCTEISYFGPSGVECKLLDGLMLVADSERLIESGVRFDEQFEFHFYDMDLCRQAELKGLKMGTWPISVVHESAGAFNTPPWRAGYERYLRKYGQ